jgi:hypothetical protein
MGKVDPRLKSASRRLRIDLAFYAFDCFLCSFNHLFSSLSDCLQCYMYTRPRISYLSKLVNTKDILFLSLTILFTCMVTFGLTNAVTWIIRCQAGQ